MNTCAYTDVYQHTHIHVDTHMYKMNTQSHTHKVICPKPPRVVRCKVKLLAKAAMGRKERTDDGDTARAAESMQGFRVPAMGIWNLEC